MPVWLMPVMAEATTEKEPIDEEAESKSPSSLRASGVTGAPSPFPVLGAAQLLTPLIADSASHLLI
jgi:hypothetical protein